MSAIVESPAQLHQSGLALLLAGLDVGVRCLQLCGDARDVGVDRVEDLTTLGSDRVELARDAHRLGLVPPGGIGIDRPLFGVQSLASRIELRFRDTPPLAHLHQLRFKGLRSISDSSRLRGNLRDAIAQLGMRREIDVAVQRVLTESGKEPGASALVFGKLPSQAVTLPPPFDLAPAVLDQWHRHLLMNSTRRLLALPAGVWLCPPARSRLSRRCPCVLRRS